MLYTTYFARLKALPDGVVPVSICGKAPDWYTGIQYKKLAPRWGFFSQWRKSRDNHFYVRHFNDEVLDRLNAEHVFNEIVALAGTDNVALICYERPEQFCHRHIVANWFRENGYEIKELGS